MLEKKLQRENVKHQALSKEQVRESASSTNHQHAATA